MYGGQEHPEPPLDTLGALVADLMELDNSVVIQTGPEEGPEFESVSREDVDQGPLVKVSQYFNIILYSTHAPTSVVSHYCTLCTPTRRD